MNIVRGLLNLFQFNRTNWKALTLSFIVAVIFWLFNSFNKEHTTSLSVPVQFIYDQQKFAEVHPLPVKVDLYVTGSGWNIIRKTFSIKKSSFIIPLDKPMEIKKILTRSLTPMLQDYLTGVKVGLIVTDTLHINLDQKIKRDFNLIADFQELKVKEGHGIVDAKVNPSIISLEGAKKVINSIPETITLQLPAQQISRSFKEDLEIPLFGSETLKRTPATVTVDVTVDELKSYSMKVTMESVNKPRRSKLPQVDSVDVTLLIPASRMDEFLTSSLQVKASVDYSKKQKGDFQLPGVSGLPSYVQVIAVDSVKVK